MANAFLFQANPGNGLGHSRNLRSVIVVSSHDCPLLVKADSHPNRTTTVMTAPRGIPLFIHISSTYLLASSEGVSYSADLILSHRLTQLSPTDPRAATYGVLYPRGILAHALTRLPTSGAWQSREERVLGTTLDGRYTPTPDSCRYSNLEAGWPLCT